MFVWKDFGDPYPHKMVLFYFCNAQVTMLS